MKFAGFPKGFNPYAKTTSKELKDAWVAEVSKTYYAVLANATSGYGLLGDVFEGGGRRGVLGTTTTKTLRGAETKVEKVSTKPRCTAILKSGVNIGKPCNSIISIDGSQFCKRHSH